MTPAERKAVRRACGYTEPGEDAGDRPWRWYQARGLLEFRMDGLTRAEGDVVRRYLDNTPDRLCGFLGVPPGPNLGETL